MSLVNQDCQQNIRSGNKLYHIEMDNGLGGDFTELQGFTVNSMAL
jgi:hypothetical protein